MVKDLPAYLDGEVRLFNFAEEGINHDSLEWLMTIQRELKEEWIDNLKSGRGDTGFIHNQSSVLEAFHKGRLYGLCMPPTEGMLMCFFQSYSVNENLKNDPHFMKHSCGLGRLRFPVFCAVDDDNRIELLWVAPRLRRRGLGTRLVECLKTQGVSGASFVEDAVPFWQRVGTVTYSTSHAQVVFE